MHAKSLNLVETTLNQFLAYLSTRIGLADTYFEETARFSASRQFSGLCWATLKSLVGCQDERAGK